MSAALCSGTNNLQDLKKLLQKLDLQLLIFVSFFLPQPGNKRKLHLFFTVFLNKGPKCFGKYWSLSLSLSGSQSYIVSLSWSFLSFFWSYEDLLFFCFCFLRFGFFSVHSPTVTFSITSFTT